jgi:hypothetical protein
MVMPVVIGATGIVTKVLEKKFGSQTRNTVSIFTLQNTSMLGTMLKLEAGEVGITAG